ncbi:MAG: TIGR03088 family PEP-CTERM/XrtA system glycosyltransferase [Nitrospira sp.]
MASVESAPPLIVHVIFRLAMGGLENGLVNLINTMPAERYRHAIVSLTDCTDFQRRITRTDVQVVALHKRPGHDFGVYRRAWRVFRELRPAIVHTRNFPTLEFLAIAACAGKAARIHGEHGRDVYDLDGSKWKYNVFRRIMQVLVDRYVAVSRDLASWLVGTVGAAPERVAQIYNGVDTVKFHPGRAWTVTGCPRGFFAPGTVVVGTVGRMETVKDQVTLVRAFLHLLCTAPHLRDVVRLMIVGDGPLRDESLRLVQAAHAESSVWLPGARSDVPDLLRCLDVFVLPSLAEGISNTILEAMASGLPVIATRVGGNVELIEEERTGLLVPPSDPEAMAAAIRSYAEDRARIAAHGVAARKKAETEFSLRAMVERYVSVYDGVLAGEGQQLFDGWTGAQGVTSHVRPVRTL